MIRKARRAVGSRKTRKNMRKNPKSPHPVVLVRKKLAEMNR